MFFFSAFSRLVIAVALQALLKTVPIFDAEWADLIQTFVDDVGSLRAATTEVNMEI